MSSLSISQALEEVQKAYKLVYDFNKALQDTLLLFFEQFDQFTYNARSVQSSSKINPLEYTGNHAIPTNYFAVLYTRSAQRSLCKQAGDAMLSCEVFIHDGLRTEKMLEPYVTLPPPYVDFGLYIAMEDAPDQENDALNDWGASIWGSTVYPPSGTAKVHDSAKHIAVYAESIDLARLKDAESIRAVAETYKQNVCTMLGVTL